MCGLKKYLGFTKLLGPTILYINFEKFCHDFFKILFLLSLTVFSLWGSNHMCVGLCDTYCSFFFNLFLLFLQIEWFQLIHFQIYWFSFLVTSNKQLSPSVDFSFELYFSVLGFWFGYYYFYFVIFVSLLRFCISSFIRPYFSFHSLHMFHWILWTYLSELI